MTYSQLLHKLKLYLHAEGQEEVVILKDFINESIYDFGLLHNWKFLINSLTLTLDGSGSYDLSTLISNHFFREYKLLLPYGSTVSIYDNNNDVVSPRTEWTKYNYETYIQLQDKAYTWAISGNTIYINGNSGDMVLMYIGDTYPLSSDDDTSNCLTYYPEAIKRMAIIKYLDHIAEDLSVIQREELQLSNKLLLIKKSEKIGEHAGKYAHFRRG